MAPLAYGQQTPDRRAAEGQTDGQTDRQTGTDEPACRQGSGLD